MPSLRIAFKVLGAVCALALLPMGAQAESYPIAGRPITLVIGYPPGGSTDLTARVVADELGSLLKTTIVVENQGGAGGAVAAQRVARAAPDGHTLMVGANNELIINQYINREVKYDGLKDFTPIALVASQPLVLVATAKSGVRNVQEFVETVQRNPGRFSYGSSGIGTSLHLLGESMKDKAKLDLVHVPYRGVPRSPTTCWATTSSTACLCCPPDCRTFARARWWPSAPARRSAQPSHPRFPPSASTRR